MRQLQSFPSFYSYGEIFVSSRATRVFFPFWQNTRRTNKGKNNCWISLDGLFLPCLYPFHPSNTAGQKRSFPMTFTFADHDAAVDFIIAAEAVGANVSVVPMYVDGVYLVDVEG
jgi:hypothetical protein